jgi:hypothetical protein
MTRQRRVEWAREYNGSTTDLWLFVLGLHGSGTTLLKTILEHHPRVRSMPREGQYYTNATPQVVMSRYVRRFTERLDLFRLTEADSPLAALRAQFDWSFVYPTEKGIKLEKTTTNLIRARWLQAHFEPSRFVTLFRDPYAVCASTRRRYRRIPIEDIARQWKLAHDILLEDLPYLRSNLVLYYEDLCARLDRELQRLSEFLELEPTLTRSMLPPVMPTRNNLRRAYMPIQDLNAENRACLTAAEMETIRRVAGETIARIGYPRDAADGAAPLDRLAGGGRAR